MSRSLAEELALLPEEEREEILEGLDPEALQWDWDFWARPEQMPPSDEDWNIFLALAGRGFGKSRSATEWLRQKARITKYGQLRMSITARTAADARDVVVEGESGLLAVSPPSERPEYQPSKRKLTWPNGNTALLFCVDEKTEVFVRHRGWLTYRELDEGMEVLTLNTEGEEPFAEWQPSSAPHVFPVKEEPLLLIESKGHSSLTTLDHRWPLCGKRGVTKFMTSKEIALETPPEYNQRFYSVTRTDKPKSAWWPADKFYVYIMSLPPPDLFKIVQYTGDVWCPTTPNQTWLARRDGKVYFTGNTSEEPSTLRGPQFHYSVADEFAAWRQIPDEVGMTAWANLRIATRLGVNPQIFVATTPKRVQSLRDLLEEAQKNPKKIIIRRGSTMDNASNLAESYMDGILGVYDGTKLGRQELYGEMLDDIEGALFSMSNFDQFRANTIPIGTPLKVVGVDPTVAEKPGDECGIVVMASTAERDLYKRQAWVLEDASVHGAPDVWAKRVVDTARKWGAPVVAEKNQGGALIRNAIQAIDSSIPVFEVWSKQGKALRAEPISLIYEQGRVHHLGYFAELEDQASSWEPESARKSKSPDRLDALVLAATALLILPPKGFGGGVLSARVPRGTLPPTRSAGRGRVSGGRRAAVYGVNLKKRW